MDYLKNKLRQIAEAQDAKAEAKRAAAARAQKEKDNAYISKLRMTEYQTALRNKIVERAQRREQEIKSVFPGTYSTAARQTARPTSRAERSTLPKSTFLKGGKTKMQSKSKK